MVDLTLNNQATEIGLRLQPAQRILLTSHIRPDGDAVGSLLGFGLALQAAGKTVQMVLSDGLPKRFEFLTGSEQVEKQVDGEFDLFVVLDSSDKERIGTKFGDRRPIDINIDHHVTNLYYALNNLVDIKAVATTQILAEWMPKWDLPVTRPVADALLTGLITDTIGFRTSNMTPEAMRVAAELMELGCDLPDLYGKALIDRSFDAIRLWGAGLSGLQREGSLVWTSITASDREVSGYLGRDDADLVNVLSSIREANIAIIFVDQGDGHVKVSWRSRPGFDVSKIAFQFGGGGHPAASGADVKGSLDQVQHIILRETLSLLNGKGY